MKNKRSILKTMFLLLPLTVIASPLAAKDKTVTSPNGGIVVTLSDKDGIPSYTVVLGKQTVILPSRLGLNTDFCDLTRGLYSQRCRACLPQGPSHGMARDEVH